MPVSSQSGSSDSMADKTVAFDMLKDSKFCISAIAMAATESSNAQFRTFLSSTLEEAVSEHFLLSDMLISKGWYTPTNIQQQLQTDIQMANQFGNSTK